MKRYLLLCLIVLFVSGGVVAQQDSSGVLLAVQQFEKALLEKNEALIETLVSPQLIFGHSNGWVQDKQAVLKDMRSGHLSYLQINPSGIRIRMMGKKAVVEEKVEVEVKLDATQVKLKLFVLQYWERHKGQWKLVLRQSAKQS